MPDLVSDIEFIDQPPGVGDYRYVATDAWWLAGTGVGERRYDYLSELLTRQWIPFNTAGEWLLERRTTGRRRWVRGDQAAAEADGLEIRDPWPVGRWTAPAGAFFGEHHGSWQTPTVEFLSRLPRDPHSLQLVLAEASNPNRPGPDGVFTYALDALRSELVPADLRRALVLVLLSLPGIQLDVRGAAPDGRPAAALQREGTAHRIELFLDPHGGTVIAERSTVTDAAFRGLTPGTVTKEANVHRGVAAGSGVVPT